MLYLNACFANQGHYSSSMPRLAVLKSAACTTTGYLASPRFAEKVLGAVESARRRGVAPFVDALYGVSWLFNGVVVHHSAGPVSGDVSCSECSQQTSGRKPPP